MAKKIVPSGVGGYPDLNLYDDSQDSTWLENMFTNLPGEIRAAKNTQEEGYSDSLNMILNSAGAISDESGWTNLMNSLESVGGNVNDYGSDSTKVALGITKSIVGAKQKSFMAFDKAVNNMFHDYTESDGLLNPENFQWENVKDKKPEDIRNLMLKVNTYRAQIFDAQGNPKFANYSSGDLTAESAIKYFDYFDRHLSHLGKSFSQGTNYCSISGNNSKTACESNGGSWLSTPGKISEAEFTHIFNNPNLSKAEFQTYGANVATSQINKIKTLDANLYNNRQFLFKLESAQTETIGQILAHKDTKEEVVEDFLELEQDAGILVLNQMSQYTPKQLKQGYYFNEKNEKVFIQGNIVETYTRAIKNLTTNIADGNTARNKAVEIHDWWAPYPYDDSQEGAISGVEVETNTSSEGDGDGGDDGGDTDIEVSQDIKDYWGVLSDKDKKNYLDEHDIDSMEKLQTVTGGDVTKAPKRISIKDKEPSVKVELTVDDDKKIEKAWNRAAQTDDWVMNNTNPSYWFDTLNDKEKSRILGRSITTEKPEEKKEEPRASINVVDFADSFNINDLTSMNNKTRARIDTALGNPYFPNYRRVIDLLKTYKESPTDKNRIKLEQYFKNNSK